MDNTIKYYDEHAEEWAKGKGILDPEKSFWQNELEKYKVYLPSGKIVEFGSGAGKEANYLIGKGYKYTGIDASKGLIEVAKIFNPTGNFLLANLNSLSLQNDFFDGFVSFATLLHITKGNMPKVLDSITSCLHDGAVGLITLKAGSGEKIDEKYGRFFNFYSADEFSKTLKNSGFEILDNYSKNDEKFKVWWLVFFVRKIASLRSQ